MAKRIYTLKLTIAETEAVFRALDMIVGSGNESPALVSAYDKAQDQFSQIPSHLREKP